MIVPINKESRAARIPEYLVYRHFMGWISSLDIKALNGDIVGMDILSSSLTNEQLGPDDLAIIREEARSLKRDIDRRDNEVRVIVRLYRARATEAARNNATLPPAPPEINRLERERIAVLVNHMVTLRERLGPIKTQQLEAFLSHAFVPHLSLRVLMHPRSQPFEGGGAAGSSFNRP
jgi:hypothetical protein